MTESRARALERTSAAAVSKDLTNRSTALAFKFAHQTTRESKKLVEDAPPKQFRLMDLLYDIRHRILEFIEGPCNTPVFLRGNGNCNSTRVPLPSVTRAGDRQLRLECILVALKQQTLEIHSWLGNATFQAWLAKLDFTLISASTGVIDGYGAVHSLCFPYFSSFPHASLPATNPNNDLELMRLCSSLREVKIRFGYIELEDRFSKKKAVSQLRKEYRLDRMLELSSLKKLVLYGPIEHGVGKESEGRHSLTNLAAWFRWEFALRGRILSVALDTPGIVRRYDFDDDVDAFNDANDDPYYFG